MRVSKLVKNGFNSVSSPRSLVEAWIPNGNQEQARRPEGEQKPFKTNFGTSMLAGYSEPVPWMVHASTGSEPEQVWGL